MLASVQVYWNDANVGRTPHVNNTLDPAWDREIFHIQVDPEGPNSVVSSTLRVVCLDWDKYGSDDVLGHVELKGSHILDISNGAYHSRDGQDTTSTKQLEGKEYTNVPRVDDFIQALRRHEREHTDPMIVNLPRDVFGQDCVHGLRDGGGPRLQETDFDLPGHVSSARGSYREGNQACLEDKGVKPQCTHVEMHADMQRGGPDSDKAKTITHGEEWEAYDGRRATGGSTSSVERGHEEFQGQGEGLSGEVRSCVCPGSREQLGANGGRAPVETRCPKGSPRDMTNAR